MQKNTKLPSLKGIKNLNTTVLLKKQWYDLNFIFNQNDNTKKALSYPSKLLKAPRTSYSTKKPPEKNPSKCPSTSPTYLKTITQPDYSQNPRKRNSFVLEPSSGRKSFASSRPTRTNRMWCRPSGTTTTSGTESTPCSLLR